MKFASFIAVLFFNWIIWTLVKTVPIRKSLARQVEKDYTANKVNKILNDGAESSVNPQIQKYKKTLKPKLKIAKKDTDKGKGKVLNKGEYNKEYYQKNKEKLIEKNRNYYEKNKEYFRKYREQNKEKICENLQNYYKRNKEKYSQATSIYYQKNKEKLKHQRKIYYQNNKEKESEYMRKYRQKKKNVQSDKNEGTSFVNSQTDDFTNKGKLPIVCEMEGNLFDQEVEECNNGEEEETQIEIDEPNKVLEYIIKNKDVNKNFSFDLNEIPEDEE